MCIRNLLILPRAKQTSAPGLKERKTAEEVGTLQGKPEAEPTTECIEGGRHACSLEQEGDSAFLAVGSEVPS